MEKKTSNGNMAIELPPFIIAIDDREKIKLNFPESVRTEVVHLPFGDYSIVGFEGNVAIERKSITDLIQTLWSHTITADGVKQPNSERFCAELSRWKEAGAVGYIIVEGTEDDLERHFHFRANKCAHFGFRQRADFQKTLAFISSLEMRYGHIFKFARATSDAAAKVYQSLYHAYRIFVGLSKDPIGNYNRKIGNHPIDNGT